MAIHGRNGYVRAGVTTVGGVTSFSYEETGNEIDVTVMGSAGQPTVAGPVKGSGSLECYFSALDGGQSTIASSLATGGQVQVALQPNSTLGTIDTSQVYYSGIVRISSSNISASKDDLVTASFSFVGILTRVDP